MAVVRAINELLERSGLTKSELSRKSGVSRALLDDYLKGRRQPGVGQLERLGRAVGLGLDVGWVPIEPGVAVADVRPTPKWARPNPAMTATPLNVAERAQVLERVVAAGMSLRRRPAGPLTFPPFRSLSERRR